MATLWAARGWFHLGSSEPLLTSALKTSESHPAEGSGGWEYLPTLFFFFFKLFNF